jgi:hypothetical protein
MKRISSIALMFAGLVLTAGSALAQNNRAKAEIPFSFTVGNRVMPAGTYEVSTLNSSNLTISFDNWSQKAHVMVLGQPDQENPDHANKLVFDRIGDQYFLHEIRSANSSMNLDVPPTKAEKRAKANTQDASVRVETPVLIALK